MSLPLLQQRCWNHESREAVCLCPQCGRSYCRECVSEHDFRLLCAACLRTISRVGRPVASSRFAFAGLALAGLFIGWLLFFLGGEALMTLSARMERTSWQNR
jgi:hypothetical protein